MAFIISRKAQENRENTTQAKRSKVCQKIKMKFKIYLMLQSITKNGFANGADFGTMMMKFQEKCIDWSCERKRN